jgi:hypothetical protein
LIPNGFLVLYSYFHKEGWFWAAGYASGRVDAMHFEASDETLWQWYHEGFETSEPKVVELPKLLVNGNVVRGAYLVKDKTGVHWYCTEGALSEILGGTTQTPDLVAPVSVLMERWEWKQVAYTGRLASTNRAYIRAVKAALTKSAGS